VREHLAKGGRAVGVANSVLVALHGEQTLHLLDLECVRSQAFGLSRILVDNLLAAAGAGLALGIPTCVIRQGLESARRLPGDALFADGERRLLVTPARNPSALAAWLHVIEASFPGRQRNAAIGIPGDWRREDAIEMGRLLRGAFVRLCLVAESDSVRTEELIEIIQHPALTREKSWAAAIDRIFAVAGPSDFVFVGPSKRAGCDQANEHCTERNMARLS
jgi:UDP-N-acetylmuramyl tripeptide synthase